MKQCLLMCNVFAFLFPLFCMLAIIMDYIYMYVNKLNFRLAFTEIT